MGIEICFIPESAEEVRKIQQEFDERAFEVYAEPFRKGKSKSIPKLAFQSWNGRRDDWQKDFNLRCVLEQMNRTFWKEKWEEKLKVAHYGFNHALMFRGLPVAVGHELGELHYLVQRICGDEPWSLGTQTIRKGYETPHKTKSSDE